MLEKRYRAVAPQLFTANGTANGLITVPDTTLFKVKQDVHISANTLPTLYKLEVKDILSQTQMIIGPDGGAINLPTDLSAYTVALSAVIFCPAEQKRPAINSDEYMRAVYAEEPTVALRTFQVDELGNAYDSTNPLPVAFDGTISIGSVSIVEGGNTLTVNPDGSLNVKIEMESLEIGTVDQGLGGTSAWKVDGSAVTQPVSAVALPLPAGASTSALQTTANASLVSIDSKLTSPLTVTGPLTDTQLRATPVPVSGAVSIVPHNYDLILDDYTTANITYIGKATIGSATSAAVWQIEKLDETTGLIITWAGVTDLFNQIWDNRTSLTYG